MQKIITKPRKVLPFAPYYQAEESHESCVVNTGYGTVSQSGYLLTAGSTTFGRVTYPSGAPITLLAVPRSANAIYIYNYPPNGVSMNLIHDFISNIESIADVFGQVTYRIKPGTPINPLKGPTGDLLAARLESISFSDSGAWMVADIPFLGMARINTSSFDMTLFDSTFNYNIGVTPAVQSAVTSNGRYVIAGSKSFARLRLYDLEACPTSTSCQYRDLWQYFTGTIPGFLGAARMRFSSDYSIRLYVVSKPGTTQNITKYILTAAGHEPANFGYLGLGDSFASGEGAYQYKAITDSGKNKCHLSQRSYPYLIAEELGLNEMESVACSGAIIADVNEKSDNYEGQVKDGVPRTARNMDNILESFSPGYLPQEYFLSKYTPEVITISTFGNDIGFSDKIMRCLEADTCYSSFEDRLEIVLQINGQFDRLVGMYGDIKEEMEGKKVYVIGYPEVAMENGNCALNVRLSNEEIEFSNLLVRYLNSVIQAAANKAGFFYVDVEESLYGHRLCETVSNNVAVNGLTSGNDIINVPFTDFDGPVGNESFHPNDMGHRLLKAAILDKTDDFTTPMPEPDPLAAPTKDIENIPLLSGAPKTNRIIYISNIDQELGNDVAVRGGLWGAATDPVFGALDAFSEISAWLHSDPVKLGDFIVDERGSANFEVMIPEDTPTGYHTVHLYGTNIAGEPVDIQKIIYVAASEEDYDGDGVPNSEDTCGFGPASGLDYDQDGIDDACDGYIGDAPAPQEPKVEWEESVKPSESNQGAVASDEQPAESPVLASESEQPAVSAYASTPYQIPASANQQPEPQVAAVSDDNSGLPSALTAAEKSKNSNVWIFFIPLTILLSVVVFFSAKQIHNK